MAYWPLGVYLLAVLALAVGMLAVSWLLGQRHHEPATGTPYEGGIVAEGSARARISARFYLLAVFFVIFDVESAFLFAWAVAGRALGWPAYWDVVVFVGILVAALVYLGRVGALEWGALRRHVE